jgi:hypothetical protein
MRRALRSVARRVARLLGFGRDGGDETGVREPRRPVAPTLAGGVALDEPPEQLPPPDAIGR